MSKKDISIIIVALIVIILGIFFYYKKPSTPAPVTPVNVPAPVVPDLTPVKGALIPEIPSALLIDPKPQIVSSGKTFDQKNNQDVLVVAFKTSLDFAKLESGYDA